MNTPHFRLDYSTSTTTVAFDRFGVKVFRKGSDWKLLASYEPSDEFVELLANFIQDNEPVRPARWLHLEE